MSQISITKKLLLFITLPQCILAVFLALAFLQLNVYPDIGLMVVFALEILINIVAIVCCIGNRGKEAIGLRVLYFLLISLLIVFSLGVFMMFEHFSSVIVLSPETLYLLCNAVSLIFLSSEIIRLYNPEEGQHLASTIVLCLILPIAIVLLLQFSYELGDISLVLSIGMLCVFLFLLGKLVFILRSRSKKDEPLQTGVTVYSRKYRMFILVVAVVLPQMGLLLNQNFFEGNLLGDFSSIWFHIIAALNGLVLLIDDKQYFPPDRDISNATNENSSESHLGFSFIPRHKLTIFYLKAAGFAFIAYFTLVFIPYMPYAILGIVFYGLGLLVYVPATIFVLQSKQLFRDFRLLKTVYKKPVVITTAIAGFLTLPIILTINFGIDRANFNNAMAYVNLKQGVQQKVDFGRIQRSISQIESTMMSTQRRGDLTFSQGVPIISAAYRYIALDNMFYTEDTLLKLRKIFMPRNTVSASENLRSDVKLNLDFETEVSVSDTEYDPKSGAYKAWVDIEMTQLTWANEYRTEFVLPNGCFITDYYLYVGSDKKRGIITDKRAAQVAYESIIRTPKDPGIIYYTSDDNISFRVFPFNGNETRRAGFQIMYSQNETLEIEGKKIYLKAEKPMSEPLNLEGLHFIPADYKKTLQSIERTPLYYFLLDAGDENAYLKNLEKAKKYAESINLSDPRYYAVSYQASEITDISATGNFPIDMKGGFNTAIAFDEIFSTVPDGNFPVILMLTDNMNRAVDFERTQKTKEFPEVDCYYRLNDDSTLTPYGLTDSERLEDVKAPVIAKALDYNGMAVSDGKSETIIADSNFSGYTGNQYLDSFILQKNTFLASENAEQISFIKESMKQRVLTKHTAFIVMETVEQEAMLLSLQEQFLNGATAEVPSVMMSEPTWPVILFAIVIIIFLKFRPRISNLS